MARFDVYPNPETGDRTTVPYLLDVQNNFLDYVETRCVVPLHLSSRFSNRVHILNPEFNVAGKSVVMNTAAIGAIPANELLVTTAGCVPDCSRCFCNRFSSAASTDDCALTCAPPRP